MITWALISGFGILVGNLIGIALSGLVLSEKNLSITIATTIAGAALGIALVLLGLFGD